MNDIDAGSIDSEDVVSHFTARAGKYDASSRWCTDDHLGALVLDLTQPKSTDRVLDVACGTGLVSRLFRGKVARVTGVDITPAMLAQARPHLDEAVLSPAESLPFTDSSFDIVVSRQGIQFMDDQAAAREMVRVSRPGGRVCLVQLCAWGQEDKDEYWRILRLRNPARRNFYLREDLARLLEAAGCSSVHLSDYVSNEDVDDWADNGAIDRDALRQIHQAYAGASAGFRRIHALREEGERIIDRMLFVVAVGVR